MRILIAAVLILIAGDRLSAEEASLIGKWKVVKAKYYGKDQAIEVGAIFEFRKNNRTQ